MRALHEYLILALVGTLVSAGFSYYANRTGLQPVPAAVQPSGPSESFAFLQSIKDQASRFWPVTLGLAVLLVMEIVQELVKSGLGGFRLTS